MILVDSNVPMYLIGAEHPHKVDARRLLERAVAEQVRLVTDVEVLQEILHRYVAIDRREAIHPCFEVMLEIVDEVLPVDLEVVERAREIVVGHPRLTARDAIHVAIMRVHSIERILSFDRHFDGLPGITRLA
ncbi:MAG: type II toxin-antitoxin system VapC family toxin [Thermoanaerobaculales bacterium]|nr:type II toxin-antitoxin system VapC family toxin [Thermoanaerobaculales bacterium]